MVDLHHLQACLFDTGGVLYHRPREDHHLRIFLEAYGLALRHRTVLRKALRAARFDAQTGRISRKTLYDAILRLNGLTDESLFPSGRDAIYADAVDIELFPGVSETLHQLHAAGIMLGTVSDSAHTAGEKRSWLAARGIAPGLWTAFVVSSETGTTKSQSAIFLHATQQLGVDPARCAFVGHATGELLNARDAGLVTIAFLPDDFAVDADFSAGSFYELADALLRPI